MNHRKTYRNAGKKWTTTEEQELLTNIQQYRGNIQEIAEVHGRSVIALNLRIAHLIRLFLEEQPKSVVANMFYKTEKDIDDLLASHAEKTAATTANRNRPAQMMQDIVDRLERIEDMMEKLLKRTKKPTKKKSKNI